MLLAAHLLRDPRPGLSVTLVEQHDDLGAGIAYATKDPDHLLNVRASNMSAFSDEPEHFSRWLREHAAWTGTGVPDGAAFAPRRLYRDYLSGLLAPHFAEGRLAIVRARAVAISAAGPAVTVRFADGGSLSGDRAVLATGNEAPSLPPARWRHDGWTSPAVPDLAAEAPVVIVGTGLTMVDRVLTLLHGGHRGPITAVSPRGLMPQEHRLTAALRLDAADVPFGAPLRQTMRWLRRQVGETEAEGGDWRSVIDALRPHTQRLWQALPRAEKARFLRHARPWWDQHRHRIAPDAAERLRAAGERGQLRIVAARVKGYEERDGGVDVLVTRRGSTEPRRLFAMAVFECRGRADDVERTENPLLRALLATGQARPDPLRLGLDVSPELALIGRDGRPSETLHAIGPVTSGVFWEVTAVPDIRVQAAELARKLTAATERV